MYKDLLISLGLNEAEGEIYDLLIQKGEKTVKDLTKLTDITRTNIYNVLTGLEELGLIEQIKKQKKTLFRPIHPNKLEGLLENEEKELKKAKLELSANLPAIVSDYNLAVGKPGVRYFEGKEGLSQVMADSLLAKTEIYSYVDVEAVQKYIKKENEQYVRKRMKLAKKKKILVSDSVFNRKYFKQLGEKATDAKYLDYQMPGFNAAMQIYDNKVSYITLQPEKMIGIIIEDELISKMQRALFEYTWSTAKSSLN